MSALHASRKQVLDAISTLPAKQWNFKPAPDRWSIAQIAEHIVVTEENIFGIVSKMLASPAGTAKSAAGNDERVMKETPDRSQKFQAPAEVVPTGRFRDRAAAVAAFRARRDQTIEFIQKTPEDLRHRLKAHPLFGEIDAYQWLLMAGAHSERHLKQIEEVKADPRFPR
ncbi:MAG: DinB family protein [Bryobacteraceae bacterium]